MDSNCPDWLAALAAGPAEQQLLAQSLALAGADERGRALALLLGELRSGAALIGAGLLVGYWRGREKNEELLERIKNLSPEILAILQALDQLTLIDRLHDMEQSDLEQLRKMLLAMASDMRAVILKLALQTVLMRNLGDKSPAEQQRLALQTRDIFAPLANRLGIAQLKWELEDRALRVLEPDIYQEISHELEEKRVDRERYITRVLDVLRHELEKFSIKINKLYGRVKHINSIYQKMKRKGIKFEQLNDIRAVRIETDTEENCYKALAVVNNLWHPIPEEFDDYISKPKANGYQSLHSSFIGPEQRILEVQIRTTKMHEHAELGVAAHWIYKEKGVRHSRQFEQQIEWLRRMIAGGDQKRGDLIFDQFKNEAFRERVYVVSPQGRVVDLPEGATPLDFAYHIHTSLGHRCRGAKVNGQMVPLTTALKNGDSVEILAQKEPNPSRDWLNDHLGYLQSGRAKAKVKSYFKKLDKEKSVAAGREMLERECRRLAIELTNLEAVAQRFNQSSVVDLYAAIGFGDLGTLAVAHEISAAQSEKKLSLDERIAKIPVKARRRSGRQSVEVDGLEDVLVNFATCCQPVPPAPLGGFISQGRGVNVHRRSCHNFEHLARVHPERIVAVNWAADLLGAFPIDIELVAYDSASILKEVQQTLANEKIPILQVDLHQDPGHSSFSGQLTLEIRDMEQLSRALYRLGQLKGMLSVQRLQRQG